MNSGYLNNNNYWSTHYDGLNGYSVADQVTGFTLDGNYDAGLRWSINSCSVAATASRKEPRRRQQ